MSSPDAGSSYVVECVRVPTTITLSWAERKGDVECGQLFREKVYLGARLGEQNKTMLLATFLIANEQIIFDAMRGMKICSLLHGRKYQPAFGEVNSLQVTLNDHRVYKESWASVDIRDGDVLELIFNPTF